MKSKCLLYHNSGTTHLSDNGKITSGMNSTVDSRACWVMLIADDSSDDQS